MQPLQRSARQQFLGDHAPLASSAEIVKPPVKQRADVHNALVAAALGGWNERREHSPFRVCHITRATQHAAVVPGPLLHVCISRLLSGQPEGAQGAGQAGAEGQGAGHSDHARTPGNRQCRVDASARWEGHGADHPGGSLERFPIRPVRPGR